jgi:hypothetical protein
MSMIHTNSSLDVHAAVLSLTKISDGLDAMAQRAVEHVVSHDRKQIDRRKAATEEQAA